MNEFNEKLNKLTAAGDLEAVEAFIKASIAEESEDSQTRSALRNTLAGFYRGVSRYAESAEEFARALEILEAVGMDTSPEYVTIQLNLAGLYRVMGQPDRAADTLGLAMDKLGSAGQHESYSYVSVLNDLAFVYQDKGEYPTAIEYAEKVLEIVRAGAGGESETALSLTNLASLRLANNQLDIAENHINEALAIYSDLSEPDAHQTAAIAIKAALLRHAGDYRGAIGRLREALELTGRFYGENAEYAASLCSISEIYELLGDYANARTELCNAVSIMDRVPGAVNNKALAGMRDKLAGLAAAE